MGCIQSYFKRAAANSAQTTPEANEKPFQEEIPIQPIQQEPAKVPIVSEEDLSPLNDDEDKAERGSLHCVEATAVRTLAASTGTVAILGTTAKYNEGVEVEGQRSVSTEDISLQRKLSSDNQKKDVELKILPSLQTDGEQTDVQQQPEKVKPIHQTSIVTTAIIESRPAHIESDDEAKVAKVEKEPEKPSNTPNITITTENEDKEPEKVEANEISSRDNGKIITEIIKNIEITDETLKEERIRSSMENTLEEIKEITNQIKEVISMDAKERQIINEKKNAEKDISETTDLNISVTEKYLPKVVESIEKVKIVENIITDGQPIAESQKSFEEAEKTSDSDKESSVEVISVILDEKLEKDKPTEKDRPNTLPLGVSVDESDQNTVEISSADDVAKNESTDVSSSNSIVAHFWDESTKEEGIETKDETSPPSKEEAKEISNTSLNTLGDESEEGSDLDADTPRKSDRSVRRFDTISSNGESSYNRAGLELEERYPSVTEDMDENLDEPIRRICEDDVFESEEWKKRTDAMRESVREEVDRIFERAIEKTADMMSKVTESKDIEDTNNLSESSQQSVMDSMVAEKGSDIDSLSFLDEQSESKSVSAMVVEDMKISKNETVCEIPKASVSLAEIKDKEKNTPVEEATAQKPPITGIKSQDQPLCEIMKITDTASEFQKSSDFADTPVTIEITQHDVIEAETKTVQPKVDDVGVEVAASKIQAGVRGYLTRKKIKLNKDEKTASEEQIEDNDQFDVNVETKGYSKAKRMSLDSKLGDFESIRKLPKLRSTLSECVEEESENSEMEKAAATIQSGFRNYKARKSICLGDTQAKSNINGLELFKDSKKVAEAKDGQSENKVLQEGDKEEKVNFDGQEIVKSIITKDLDKENLDMAGDVKSSPQTISDMTVKPAGPDFEEAVVKIQATYRGFKTRRSIQMSAAAATKIQAHFRGYKVRKSIKRSSSLNDLDSSSSSSNPPIDPEIEKYVAKIQAGVRGYLVRKRHSLQNNAAAKIQTNYRKYKSRKESKPKGDE